jgi:hypothetical protein
METSKIDLTTLSTVLEKLRLKKMDNEFRWENGVFHAGRGKTYTPEDLTILKTFRFEGESDPGDSSILYHSGKRRTHRLQPGCIWCIQQS